MAGVAPSPRIHLPAETVAFVEGDSVPIASELTLSAPDSNASEAAVHFAGAYQEGADMLSFSDQNGITGTWNPATGVLSLAGTASISNYELALRSVEFDNSSDDPLDGLRLLTFSITVASGQARASRNLEVFPVNDPPTVSPAETDLTHDGDSTFFAADIELADPDDITLHGATVWISEGLSAGHDLLSAEGTDNISLSLHTDGSGFVLLGEAPVSEYAEVIAGARYAGARTDGTRTISILVNDYEASSAVATVDINVGFTQPLPVDGGCTATDESPPPWTPLALLPLLWLATRRRRASTT